MLEGLRGEDSITEPCRREGVRRVRKRSSGSFSRRTQNLYYRWSHRRCKNPPKSIVKVG